MQTTELGWVGYCKRTLHEKEGDREIKVLEIPFKVSGIREKRLLRILKQKNGKHTDFTYEIHEIKEERLGTFETLLLATHGSETCELIDAILLHKKVRKEYRWMQGWFPSSSLQVNR